MKTTPITAEIVSNYLLPAQLSALRQTTDPLNEIIADTIARVHSEIQSNPANPTCSDSSSVPQELTIATCHLIIEALQSRIPTLKLSEDQIRNANNARLYLRRIAIGEISLNSINKSTQRIDIAHTRQRQFSYKTLSTLC